MRLLVHPDPARLEAELIDRVDAAHPREGLGRTLVLVPTRRLGEHVQRRFADRRPGWLGLEVVDLGGLARRILDESARKPLRVAGPRLLEALVRRLLAARQSNPWARFASDRPGAVGRIAGTLNDLREAGLAPRLVSRIAGEHGERTKGLASLYGVYHRALETRERSGWTDESGVVRAAAEEAERWAEGIDAVFLHGAYELIGVQLELVRALDRVAGVTAIVPTAPGTAAYEFSEAFARGYLLEPGEEPELLDDGPQPDRATRLRALYDESSEPPAAGDAIRFRHAQGPAAEVEAAVLHALRSVGDGTDPAEIAIVARSLEPYAAAIEEAFAAHPLPFTGTLKGPLRRHPLVHDFLLLLQVLDEDFPRRPTAELLKSSRVRWRTLLKGADRPSGELADAWSRDARIIGGYDEWTEEFPRWVARVQVRTGGARNPTDRLVEEGRARDRAKLAHCIAEAIELLRHSVSLADARWNAHALGLARVVERLFHEPRDDAGRSGLEGLQQVLAEMGRLEAFAGDRGTVSFSGARQWLTQTIDRVEAGRTGDEGSGIRVLDAMQLRGMTFREVHFLGWNSGVFPRAPREDPVLPDAVRIALRRRSGSPLPVKGRMADEEHLLLAISIGAARDRLSVSWQRADEAGRSRTPSIALREVGRLAFGHPRFPRVEEALHLPSHPTHWLETMVDSSTLLAPRDRRLLDALRLRGEDRLARLGTRYPELDPGMQMLRATQAFRFGDTRYDGRVALDREIDDLSVSALETLGHCPLRFFFQQVLKVRRLEEAATPFEMEAREIGNFVHDLLESIYERLIDEGAFSGNDPVAATRRAHELLDASEFFGELGPRIRRRLPVLADHHAEQWSDALREFVCWDLERSFEDEFRPAALEEIRRERLDLGQGEELTVRGRVDRRFVGPNGAVRIGDYKTSGNLERRINPTPMLKGTSLQVPLYRMLSGGAGDVELLAVGPKFDGPGRLTFSGFEDRAEASFLETMRALIGLVRAGKFPLNKAEHCSWCDYAAACRRTHPPTLDREHASEEGALLARLGSKTKRDPDGR